MPRNEDEWGRNGGRTAKALKSGGHAAGGGHNKGQGRTPQQHAVKQALARQKGKPSFWDHDDDDDDGGGTVSDTGYSEYPKHVYPWGQEGNPRDWRYVRVESLAEEEEAMAQGDVSEREGDKRKRLLKIGEIKGLKLDGRWALDKMEAAIMAAGHDPSLDPFS